METRGLGVQFGGRAGEAADGRTYYEIQLSGLLVTGQFRLTEPNFDPFT